MGAKEGQEESRKSVQGKGTSEKPEEDDRAVKRTKNHTYPTQRRACGAQTLAYKWACLRRTSLAFERACLRRTALKIPWRPFERCAPKKKMSVDFLG